EMLSGVRAVLMFFGAHQAQNGTLGRMPWWNFVDWTKEWRGGGPSSGPDGASAPLGLSLFLWVQWGCGVGGSFGSQSFPADYRQAAAALEQTIRLLYWDAARRMFADTPDKAAFSQHTNALAILAGVATGDEARELIGRIVADRSIVQCSIYFRHYLHSAVNK